MHLRKLTLAGALACGLGFGVFASTPALAVCDAYSGNCTPPGTDIGGDTEQPGRGPAPDVVTPPDVVAPPEKGAGGGTKTAGRGVSPASTTTSQPTTLPFTGGEIALLTVLGAGALAGGTALVVAGRRRAQATA